MTTIGAAWKKIDKNQKKYISVSVDEELLPLSIGEGKRLALFPIDEKPSDKAPDFRLVLFKPEDEKTENKTENKEDW